MAPLTPTVSSARVSQHRDRRVVPRRGGAPMSALRAAHRPGLVLSMLLLSVVGGVTPAHAAGVNGVGVVQGRWIKSAFESPYTYANGPYILIGTWNTGKAVPFVGRINLGTAIGDTVGDRIEWYRPAYLNATVAGQTLKGACVYRPNQLVVA